MTKVSRRNLMVLGGVSALAAACHRRGDHDEDHEHGHGGTRGQEGNYGDNPMDPGPGKLSADFYSLVIMRLNSAPKFESSFGSFDAPSKDDEKIVRAKLLEQLKGLKPGGDVQSLNPLSGEGGPWSGYDFDHWGFASARRIYIYTDTPNLKFDKRAPLTFKSVSSLLSTNPRIAESRKIEKNKTFFGAHVEEKFANGSLLYFENYFLDSNGKPRPPRSDTTDYYSMSFNLLMETAKGGAIPICIDPDGGNGMKYPPPIQP